MRYARFPCCLVFFLLPSLSPVAAIAQSAGIRGSILDPSGAAIAGAHISLSGRGTGPATASDAAGNYQFSSLMPGTYTLAIDAPGFGHYENTSIHVSRDGVLDWPVRLALQSASQSITVQGDGDRFEQVPTVGKTGTMLQDIPQSIVVISHQLSDSQGDLVLQDTVRNASGVIQGGTDGFGFADRFQIRALEARIYNDGLSDGDERNGIPHSLNGVERVEILEGPGSSLFGSGPPEAQLTLCTTHHRPVLAAARSFRRDRSACFPAALISPDRLASTGWTIGLTA
jgi:iron complex outermembrane receptor protein